MKQIIRKAIWNYDKEEEWLNRMAATGLSLVDYSWCRYVFEQTEKGQWTYRIELLKNRPAHPETAAYLHFLEENGVEVVATYMRWVYLRKKTTDGAFDVYSDLSSKLAHAVRIHQFWLGLIWMEFLAGGFNLLVGAISLVAYAGSGVRATSSIAIGLFLTALGCCFVVMIGLPQKRKIKRLRAEQRLRE